MPRDVYLDSTPLHEALSKWLDRCALEGASKPLSEETVKVIDSLGRITAEAVIANISSPFYHSSAMDGYAVRFPETFGASERTPKALLLGRQAVPVDTGDPIPDGYNAVIMIEDVNILTSRQSQSCRPDIQNGRQSPQAAYRGNEGECIEIIAPATPWQHIRVNQRVVETWGGKGHRFPFRPGTRPSEV